MLRSSTIGDGSSDNVGVLGALEDDIAVGGGVELRRRLSSEVLISGGRRFPTLRPAMREPGCSVDVLDDVRRVRNEGVSGV